MFIVYINKTTKGIWDERYSPSTIFRLIVPLMQQQTLQVIKTLIRGGGGVKESYMLTNMLPHVKHKT
jgi:hypothetical protein